MSEALLEIVKLVTAALLPNWVWVLLLSGAVVALVIWLGVAPPSPA